MRRDNNTLPDYEELFEEVKNKKNVGFRVIWKLFLQNKTDFISSILLYFVKQIAVWVIPIVLAGAINEATAQVSGKGGSIEKIWMWALL